LDQLTELQRLNAPFVFRLPEGIALQSPAFSKPFKLIATLLVAWVGLWLWQLWQGGKISHDGSTLGWFAAALAMMSYTLWHIWRSVTTLDEKRIHQSWVWDKAFDMRELAYAKLIRVPGLDWLIAPRLYVRTMLGKFAVFYAADPAMVGEFARIAKELDAFRMSKYQ
jgi:hypothetical protein